ncbi:MAG: hypothetical protein ABIP20_10570 [Chthoniobacteraceae bacterium]
MKLTRFACALLLLPFFTGCASTIGPSPTQTAKARSAMVEEIKAEPRDAYFVGRRYFKTEYKFWGFVRASGHPWREAKLVMLNENQKLAPDRGNPTLGTDNNFEYRLQGHYSGDTVYEPASNGMYPEFVLKGYELRSQTPAPIYREAGATDPNRNIIARPY